METNIRKIPAPKRRTQWSAKGQTPFSRAPSLVLAQIDGRIPARAPAREKGYFEGSATPNFAPLSSFLGKGERNRAWPKIPGFSSRLLGPRSFRGLKCVLAL